MAAQNATELAALHWVAFTSDDDPAIPLFVETIGRALAPIYVNGVTADTADEALRAALRADIARLLREGVTGACVITVDRRDGGVRVDVSPGDGR